MTVVANVVSDLIFDIGMSEGNDTDYYLRKGFRVVGVEADPFTYTKLCERFSQAIAAGRLIALNRAASSTDGEQVSFCVNEKLQGHSKLADVSNTQPSSGRIIEARTVSWSHLVSLLGVPYFCKIDIEGAEVPFLHPIEAYSPRPTYMSVEAHSLAPIKTLYDLGYRNFRLIDQRMHWRWPQPNPPLEGIYIGDHKFIHASGLFGKELPGTKWYTLEQITKLFESIKFLQAQETILHTWFDCHAR